MKIFKNWTFKWWEVALLKLCLLSVGILLALYFQDFFAGLLWLWWTIFVLTAIYLVAMLFSQE